MTDPICLISNTEICSYKGRKHFGHVHYSFSEIFSKTFFMVGKSQDSGVKGKWPTI